jgi:sugar phosphate permease
MHRAILFCVIEVRLERRLPETERVGEDTAQLSGAASKGLRGRWFLLMPAVFVTYSLAYLDRANYGFGAAAGLAATLHITSSQSALLGSLFFLGYFLFQLPGVAYARRRSASRLIFYALLMWGTLAALTGVIHSFWLLALDRLLLGVAESLIFPAMLLLLTRWFTRAERSRANTVLILGNPITVLWMSAITGYLIQAFGWQMTFVLEGVPSVAWAFVWVMVVRDRPEKATWMSAEASVYLNGKLAEEQLALPKVGGVRKALMRTDVILLAVQYFCWSMGLYGFVLWLPTIIRAGSAAGIEATGLLSAVPYLLAILMMLLVAYLSDKMLQRRALVWPFLVLSGVSLLGSFVFAAQSFWGAYGCLILAGGAMYAPYGPFFAIIPEMVPREVTAEVLAMVNSCGALGAFVGAWMVGELQARTGNSRAGYLLMAVSLIVSGLVMVCGSRADGNVKVNKIGRVEAGLASGKVS